MRGRLINPFLALVARYNAVATAADPDAGGPLTSGFDPVFREPLPKASGSFGNERKEYEPLLVPCQVEFDDQFDQQSTTSMGNDPKARVRLVYHFADLEELGLVDLATGTALLRLNDRLISIHRFEDQALIQKAGMREGLYCSEARPVSFGLSGGERNLLVCTYEERAQAFQGGA